MTYVADNGQELFSHTYGSILQCCIAIDGISFAYIARREKDNKYLCHVFQALTYEEVSQLGWKSADVSISFGIHCGHGNEK